MSTDMTLEILSSKSEDTFSLGEKLGKNCRGGEVFVLSSDLGGGKTTFTKGLGTGLDCQEVITSPTFTVSNVYRCRDAIELHHFDFYRLGEAGIMSDEIVEVLGSKEAVVVIEWADIVAGVLPTNRIDISFSRLKTSENHRQIDINIPKKLKYLKEGVK